jgi:DNA-directed RNA polymerase specialized sigma24 family protein
MASSLRHEVARPLAPSSLGDTTLVHLARNGDLGAFAELVQRHSWTAWEAAYAITGDAGDAAEAVSESFTKLLKPGRVVRYENSVALQTAVLSTTRTTAIETVRRSGHDGADGVYDIGGSGARQTRARGGLPIVSAAFRSLPERWRSALWLIEVQGVEPEMAAAVLGVSGNGLAQLAMRSRTGLRERYLQAHIQARVAEACRPVVEHLAAYVTGQMTPHDAARIDSHLDGCVECKQRRLDLDDLGAMLHSLAVPIPATLAARTISRWKLEISTAASVTRPQLRLVPFPTTARKPLAGAALGVLGVGIIGAAIVGGPLLNHGLGGGGIAPAAASPSEVNRPFQLGNAVSPVFANNLLTVGSGPLAALSGAAAPGANAAAATAANPAPPVAAPAGAAGATGVPGTNGLLPAVPPAPAPPAPTTPTLPQVPPAPSPPSPPITLPPLPPPLGSGGSGGGGGGGLLPKLPPPLPNPPPPVGSGGGGGGGGGLPLPPTPTVPQITVPPQPSLPAPTSPPPPSLLPKTTLPTLP